MKKQCNVCKELKDVSEFYSFERQPDSKGYERSQRKGLNYCCKSCTSDYNRKYNQEKKSEKRATFYKNRYGLSQEDFNELMDLQNGCCAICKQPFEGQPHVDHEHVEGFEKMPAKEKRKYIRGLLCDCHNRMIGQGHDNAEELENGARYLREYERTSKHR